MKGKENKFSYDLSRRFYLASICMYKIDLKAKNIKVVASDEFTLQVKEGLLANPIETKYAGYRTEEDHLPLYKDRLYIPNNPGLMK